MTRFTANPRLEASIRQQAAFHEAMAARTEAVKEAADRIASTLPDKLAWMPRPGQETFEADLETLRVVNTDHAAAMQEWGGRNNPAYAPLRRAARAVGLRSK